MKPKKYVCPNCHKEMSEVRCDENANCSGIYIKCKKCGQVVEISIKMNKTIDSYAK